MLIDVEIAPFVPDPVTFTPNPDPADEYDGTPAGSWLLTNAAFTDEMIGGEMTVTNGGELDGTYTLTSLLSADVGIFSPLPSISGSPPVSLAGATVEITFQPADVNGPGPGISGVNVTPVAKEGQRKSAPSRRAT